MQIASIEASPAAAKAASASNASHAAPPRDPTSPGSPKSVAPSITQASASLDPARSSLATAISPARLIDWSKSKRIQVPYQPIMTDFSRRTTIPAFRDSA
ncbi:hypothetical protein [Sphingomonas sp. Ant H11]|uniref:hypothetical protein n=1 Tax=Sphingomonas sp. Ant H11 TaxID=1564113 RepID=UPI000AC8E544|nr:hypothetical protein [Sphingomonas sp. Ant H11]